MDYGEMDYGAAAKSYVDAFLQNVLWSEVNHRIERAKTKRA
jgi:superoxide dismutase